jgi:hypothetical protein
MPEAAKRLLGLVSALLIGCQAFAALGQPADRADIASAGIAIEPLL